MLFSLPLSIPWLHAQWRRLVAMLVKWEVGKGYLLTPGRPQSSSSEPVQCWRDSFCLRMFQMLCPPFLFTVPLSNSEQKMSCEKRSEISGNCHHTTSEGVMCRLASLLFRVLCLPCVLFIWRSLCPLCGCALRLWVWWLSCFRAHLGVSAPVYFGERFMVSGF